MPAFPPLRLRSAFSLGGLTPRELAVQTWNKINEHEIFTRAASISFYAMLAFVPLLAIILTVAVQLLPDITGAKGGKGIGNLTVGELQQTLRSIFPAEAYEVVNYQIERIQTHPPIGLLSVGLAISLWTASSLFLAVIDSMNAICGVKETRPFWKLRLTAIVMTILQAILLIASLLAIVLGPEILRWMGLDPTSAMIAQPIQWIAVLIMVLLTFALSFYVAPDAEQSWEWITPGSIFGAIVFMGFSLLFRLYIQNFADYDKTYGTLGGVMVLMFWLWVSSTILLASAQVNKVIEHASPLGKSFGQKKEPPPTPDFQAMPPEVAKP